MNFNNKTYLIKRVTFPFWLGTTRYVSVLEISHSYIKVCPSRLHGMVFHFILNIFSIFSRNSEANASEFIINLEEMFLVIYWSKWLMIMTVWTFSLHLPAHKWSMQMVLNWRNYIALWKLHEDIHTTRRPTFLPKCLVFVLPQNPHILKTMAIITWRQSSQNLFSQICIWKYALYIHQFGPT